MNGSAARGGALAIEAEGLRKAYGDVVAVAGVDLAIGRGEIVGFLGPNGAGKTTTIKMLTGLVRPSAGRAAILGHDVQRDPVAAKSHFGYVPDTPNLYGKLRGREFLRFMARLYRVPASVAEPRAAELLRVFELADAANDLAEGYSHGMQQKLALAGALVHDPAVLFLDEPTVGLDPRSARLIKQILLRHRDRGGTVFLSTHILEIAERLCDRLVIIDKGRIVAAGTMDELRGQVASEAGGAAGAEGSLEEIFLRLTGGADYAELAAVLR
ncbi:MAG TPA: ABC transporter ATP-binding protein [Chloroflexota bacterium]|nr:ABC transporter ATP-binding protein [Chloroflexota bacterium]